MSFAKRWFRQTLTLLGVAFVVLLAGCQDSPPTNNSSNTDSLEGANTARAYNLLAADTMAPVIGDPEAPVKVHGFVRLTCPPCRDYVLGPIRALIQTTRIRYAFHGVPNRPVAGGGGSKGGVEREWTMSALHCAKRQNAFQEYHDRLFFVATRLRRNQNVDQVLFRQAQQIGLDVDKLHQCIISGGGQEQIAAAQALADSLDIEEVPTFFVNGTRASSIEEMETLILSAQKTGNQKASGRETP